MPVKPTKWCINTWVLAYSSNGHLLHIYEGRHKNLRQRSMEGKETNAERISEIRNDQQICRKVAQYLYFNNFISSVN
jgi:hypothetical protein